MQHKELVINEKEQHQQVPPRCPTPQHDSQPTTTTTTTTTITSSDVEKRVLSNNEDKPPVAEAEANGAVVPPVPELPRSSIDQPSTGSAEVWLHPKDQGWSASRFVLSAAATEFMIWGASTGYGSFQDYHHHNPSSPFHTTSLTATSSVGTTLVAGQHFIPLISFGLYSLFPTLTKHFTYTCVVGSSLSLLIASLGESVALLIVFQGLLLGIFGGNLFTTVVLWLPGWFDRRRGLATALIFAGSAIGGIVWPIIFTELLERIGFRWTLRTWSLIQLVVSGSAVYFLQPNQIFHPRPGPVRWRGLIPGLPRSLLSTLTLLNVVVILTQTTAWYSVALNISNYASSMGFSSATSTGILSAFNASAAVTYFFLGYLVDRFPYPLIMATSTALNLVFTALVFGFAANSLTKIILYVVFVGVSGGGFTTFLTPVSRDVEQGKTGTDEYSLRFLYLVCIRGAATMVGPIIAVQFYPTQLGKQSTYGSYGFTGFIAFISATLTVATLASLAIFAYKKWILPQRQRQKSLSNPVTPPPEPRVGFGNA